MRIGVTGQIGTGKSTVAEIFAEQGAAVISADKIGRLVVERDKIVLKRLAGEFGKDILTPGGKLRRKALGRKAFSDPESKALLNRIVHPVLLTELDKQVRKAEKKNPIVVIDAALLIDWGWQKRVDLTVLVHAGKEIKISRLLKKGYSRREALMRLKSQMKYSELRALSDLVIFNNRDRSYLKKRVLEIIQKISSKWVDIAT